jgi:hypothetical protein
MILSGAASAGEPLSESEIALEAAFLAAMAIDYGQTLDIKNHYGMYEKNSLLGRHPSDSRITNYFLGAAIGHVAVTYLMPRKYRPAWQWGTLGLQIGTIYRNHQIGLRVDFH